MITRLVSRTRCYASVVCLSLACMITGCDSGNLSPVSGKVTNGADLLTTGAVVFHPQQAAAADGTKLAPRAEIQSDGSYTLYTNAKLGAPNGTYKVTVAAQQPVDSSAAGADAYAAPKYLVQQQYMNVDTTPLTIEVKSGAAEGAYDLKLDPK